jgi:hypothetical protein
MWPFCEIGQYSVDFLWLPSGMPAFLGFSKARLIEEMECFQSWIVSNSVAVWREADEVALGVLTNRDDRW